MEEKIVGHATILFPVNLKDDHELEKLYQKIKIIAFHKSDATIIIDFSKINRHINSVGVGILMKCKKVLDDTHGELRLCSLSAKIENMLKISGLIDQFKIYANNHHAFLDLKKI